VWPLLTKKSLNAWRTFAPGHSIAAIFGRGAARAPRSRGAGFSTTSDGSNFPCPAVERLIAPHAHVRAAGRSCGLLRGPDDPGLGAQGAQHLKCATPRRYSRVKLEQKTEVACGDSGSPVPTNARYVGPAECANRAAPSPNSANRSCAVGATGQIAVPVPRGRAVVIGLLAAAAGPLLGLRSWRHAENDDRPTPGAPGAAAAPAQCPEPTRWDGALCPLAVQGAGHLSPTLDSDPAFGHRRRVGAPLRRRGCRPRRPPTARPSRQRSCRRPECRGRHSHRRGRHVRSRRATGLL
jgi:hypothetical protein